MVKPDPEIFKLLICRRDLDVRRTVFIDDSADNVAIADQLGFATIHFNEATTDLRTELLRLGLPADYGEAQLIHGAPDMADPVLLEDAPSAAEFIELRRIMGSPYVDQEAASKTVSGALFTVCLRQEGRLLGLARVVGDGVLYFYVSDVIVRPELRGSGYGVLLMEAVLGYLRRAAHPGAMIVVVPLKGRETFYERFGFERCPDERFGFGMYLPEQIAGEKAGDKSDS